MKECVTEYELQIKAVESESRITTLAYKLQGGELAPEPVEAEESEADADAEESATEEMVETL